MPLSDSPGHPIWVELYTSDPEAASHFYGRLFGWTAEKAGPDYGDYLTFQHRGGPISGCMVNDATTRGVNSWSIYLESDNVEDTVRMAEANGGHISIEPLRVGDLGHMAFVTDPAGALVGIWQPGTMEGFSARGETGAPAWFELFTTDYPRALEFYANAFGWDLHTVADTDEFRYSTLGGDELALAGIMDASTLPGDPPSAWSVYFAVDDTDTTVAAAEEAGGSVLRAPEDSPYGRLAELTDPQGARFKILGPNLVAP
jgi:predicted enzyme related to lactoylglutathione lyase